MQPVQLKLAASSPRSLSRADYFLEWNGIHIETFGSITVRYVPMLDRYLGDCMGINNWTPLIISINLSMGINIVIPMNIINCWQWICQGERIFLYSSYYVTNAILNHIDTTTISLKYEGSYMVLRPKWMVLRTQIPSNTHVLLVSNKCGTVKINTIWFVS